MIITEINYVICIVYLMYAWQTEFVFQFTFITTDLKNLGWNSIPILERAVQVLSNHYNDIIMDAMASQITSLAIVYSTVY